MAAVGRTTHLLRCAMSAQAKRHFGATSICSQQATEPIQKLFLDKIQEYKKMAMAGKPPGLDEKALHDRLERVKASYGADKEDFTKFPSISYTDPELELVQMEGAEKTLTFTMNEHLDEVYQESGTPFDYGYGPLNKDIFNKEYKADFEKRGFFNKELTYVRKPTTEHKNVVQPYWEEPAKEVAKE